MRDVKTKAGSKTPISRIYRDLERRGAYIPIASITGGQLASEFSTIIKTVDYTTSTIMVILVDASSGGVTIALPEASESKNKVYYIKKTDTSSNKVIIEPDGTDTIDDEDSFEIVVPYTCITVSCDGTKWWII